jgi:hypothetical protein
MTKHDMSGAPELVEIEIGENVVSLPRVAFEDGARILNLSLDFYTGTAWYRDSVQAFFSALKASGLSKVEF